MAGPNSRQPLFVNQSTRRGSLQLDIYRNIAALVIGSAGVLYPHVALDPTFYKKPPPQIDLYPNIAALATAVAPVQIPPMLDVPIFRRFPPQVDVYQNIAVQFPTIVIPTQPFQRAPFFVNTNFRQWPAPDIPVNVAIGIVPLASVSNHLAEPTFYKRYPPQIDVINNVALNLLASVGNTTTIDQLPPKIWPQIEIFPNLAANAQVVIYQPPSPIDPPPPRKYWTQIDVYPNIALKGVEPVQSIPALEWVLPTRKWPVPDVFPNPALFNFPPLIFAPEPTITPRKWATFDVYPNVAANAPPEKTPLIEPIDPWTSKRYPPQVEVFQNQAIYVAQATVPLLFESPDIPTVKLRWGQPEITPNLAVATGFPFAPSPVAPAPTISEWTTDATQVTADTINFTADGSNLIAGGGLPTNPTPQESPKGGNPGPAVNSSQTLRF